MKDLIQAIIKNAKGEFGELEKERAETCVKCPEIQDGFYYDIFKAVMKEVKGKVCGLCDCPISNKIFAKEEENICKKWLK
jgi:hypothetical protein